MGVWTGFLLDILSLLCSQHTHSTWSQGSAYDLCPWWRYISACYHEPGFSTSSIWSDFSGVDPENRKANVWLNWHPAAAKIAAPALHGCKDSPVIHIIHWSHFSCADRTYYSPATYLMHWSHILFTGHIPHAPIAHIIHQPHILCIGHISYSLAVHSGSFLAEISVRAPRKLYIFSIIKKTFPGSKNSKTYYLILNTEALVIYLIYWVHVWFTGYTSYSQSIPKRFLELPVSMLMQFCCKTIHHHSLVTHCTHRSCILFTSHSSYSPVILLTGHISYSPTVQYPV